MLGAGCAAALLVAFGGASAESVEGSIRGNTGKQASSDSSQQDYYWKVWNGALPEQRDKDDHNDVLCGADGQVHRAANRLQVRISRRRARSIDDRGALGNDCSNRKTEMLSRTSCRSKA